MKTLTVLALAAAVGTQAQAKNLKIPVMNYMASIPDSPMRNDNDGDSTPYAPFGEEARPAPLSMRADISLVYNTPSPSQVKPELIGPVQFIRTARVHEDEGTVTLPLYLGHNKDGKNAWYVLTDVTNKEVADHLGLIFTAKLGYVDQGKAVRPAAFAHDGTLVFESGTVDFSPERKIAPGTAPNIFPPSVAQPGSVGDGDYTPIVKVDGVYYNAPVLAFDVTADELQKFAAGNVDYTKVHDKVVRINPMEKTVTLKLTHGYSFAKPIFYLSTDSNDPVAATLEESTLTPALNDANQDIPDAHTGQGNERIAIVINGPMGKTNPFRQGIQSAMVDGASPINIFGGVPTINLDYSPIWDAELVQWTPDAVANHYQTRLIDLFQMFDLEQKKVLQGFGGGPIKRSGILINCPVVSRLI